MSKFKYCIQLSGAEISCLAKDLIDLMEIVNVNNIGYWYASDISTNNRNPKINPYSSDKLKLIGNNTDLNLLCSHVEQFLSGNFMNFTSQQYNTSLTADTEDEPFRKIGDAWIEIRAFDTSYFEIYADSEEIIQSVRKHYPPELLN